MSDKSYMADDHKDLIGWHNDVSNSAYHSGPGISKSGLDLVHKSINHFLGAKKEETDAMTLGTAVHAAILEPHTWPGQFVRGPDVDRRTAEWKTAAGKAQANGLTIMKSDDFDKVELMATAVLSHMDPAIALIKDAAGIAEGSLYQADPRTGLLIRCRPDYLVPDHHLIIDLKTTKDASPDEFARSCGNFRYDVQDAMYTQMVSHAFGGDWKFIFVAVENTPPYNVGVYELSAADKDFGHQTYRADLNKFAQWVEGYEQNTGYLERRSTISIPGYFRRKR